MLENTTAKPSKVGVTNKIFHMLNKIPSPGDYVPCEDPPKDLNRYPVYPEKNDHDRNPRPYGEH
jgi:hypothetical protein